jgi:hypothetical protein
VFFSNAGIVRLGSCQNTLRVHAGHDLERPATIYFSFGLLFTGPPAKLIGGTLTLA